MPAVKQGVKIGIERPPRSVRILLFMAKSRKQSWSTKRVCQELGLEPLYLYRDTVRSSLHGLVRSGHLMRTEWRGYALTDYGRTIAEEYDERGVRCGSLGVNLRR